MRIFESRSQLELFSKDQGELPPSFRKIFETPPSRVLQPQNADEACAAVKGAYQDGVPIVARGAASTAFGQVTPVFGGVVLDLSFLKAIRSLDPDLRTVTVEAGVRWADLSAYLEEHGLALGSYPSSWYSTVGGWIATGGIGVNSLGFGPLREQVLEIRLCGSDGSERRIEPGSPEFEACFETEGQMGVILAATLRVRPLPKASHPVLIPCAGPEEAWMLYSEAVASKASILHASLFNPERMHHFNHTLQARMAQKGSGVGGPFEESWSVFLFLEDPRAAEEIRKWSAGRGGRAAPDFQASYVWEERFYPLKGKAFNQMFLGNEVRIGNAHGHDYTSALSRFLSGHRIQPAIEVNAATKIDSVVITSFTGDYSDSKKYFSRLALVFRMDSIACDRHRAKLYHIGVYNTPFVTRKFAGKRLAALRRIKNGLDPKRLYNPGKFFEFKTGRTRRLPDWLHRLGFKALFPILSSPAGARFFFSAAEQVFGVGTPPLEIVRSDRVLRTWRECVNCGFCIPVCPAYLATRDERTTARGKLFVAERWLRTGELSPEDATLLQSCMHCGACTKVCQNTLDLVPVWREMEERIVQKKGKPVEAIEDFVRSVEASADYRRLLRRGFITEPAARSRRTQT